MLLFRSEFLLYCDVWIWLRIGFSDQLSQAGIFGSAIVFFEQCSTVESRLRIGCLNRVLVFVRAGFVQSQQELPWSLDGNGGL